jgi:hypothetical protein
MSVYLNVHVSWHKLVTINDEGKLNTERLLLPILEVSDLNLGRYTEGFHGSSFDFKCVPDYNKSEFLFRNWGKGSFFLTLNQPFITLLFLANFKSKLKKKL